jgi:glycosyltransferase involved in cell wall biosynthesis
MKLVGLDMAPASSPAPGTARYVSQQLIALLSTPVPWRWLPTFESSSNPLYAQFGGENSIIVPGSSLAMRASLPLGWAWKKHQCALGFCSAYFAPLIGPPVVSNFFDSNIYEHFATWRKSGRLINALLIRLLCDFSVRRSRKLFSLSKYCQQFLQDRFPKHAAKFVVTPPGMIPGSRNASSQPPPSWMPSNPRDFFLYVATFSENKNQRRLIQAYLQLRQEHPDLPSLVLIGPCQADYRQRSLDKLLAGIPADWVILPGRVSDVELIWAYQHALAYLQPSIAEGFGLPIIEAMSYSLPVACSNTTSLPETAGNAALLFDPFAPDSMAAAMLRLVREPGLRDELRAKGDRRWREFTWEKNVRLIIDEIGQLLRTQ